MNRTYKIIHTESIMDHPPTVTVIALIQFDDNQKVRAYMRHFNPSDTVNTDHVTSWAKLFKEEAEKYFGSLDNYS